MTRPGATDGSSSPRDAIAAELSFEAVWEADLRNGTMYFSPAWYAMLGYTPDDLTGAPESLLRRLTHDDDAMKLVEAYESVVASGSERFEGEFRIRAHSGAWLWMELRARLVRNECGRTVRIVGVQRDVTARKQADDALRFERSLVEAQLDASSDGVLALGVDHRILHCNQRFLVLWSIPAGLVHGGSYEALWLHVRSRLADAGDPDARAVFLDDGDDTAVHREIALSDGRTLEIWRAPINGSDGTHYGRIVHSRDVTARRHRDRALRDQERFLRSVLDHVPSPIYIYDGDRCVFTNESNARLFGRTVTDFEHSRLTDLGFDDHSLRESVAQNVTVMDHGASLFMPEVNLETDEGTRHFQIRKVPIALPDGRRACLGVADEVTARRATEAALRRSEERFRLLTEQLPDAILVLRDERVVYCNPAAVGLMALSDASEMLGSDFFERVHPDEREAVRTRIARVMTSGERAPGLEERLVRRDGTVVMAEIIGLPIEYDGAPAVLVIARDVTERKQLAVRLQQADRLVSVGTLAAGVAHEINNPLAYILANVAWSSEALADMLHPLDPENAPGIPESLREKLDEMRSALEDARQGAGRVRAIVSDLRVFSRADEDTVSPVDVCQTLDSALQLARAEFRHRARLEKDYGPVSPVLGNDARLGQVFLNLLVNAAQAIPEGNVAENVIGLKVRQQGTQILVEVSDTGCGIARELHGRIFDPFFTTKPAGEGTGLGLSICHGIVTQFGGQITVESAPGKGSTFRVALPAVELESGDESDRDTTGAGLPRLRVLVIADEPSMLAVLQRALGRDHQVECAGSGTGGLAMLAAQTYDVIFCDLMMPDLSGQALYERIRDERPLLASRFVFMAGGAFSGDIRNFLEQLPNRCLFKPFDAAHVRSLLAEVVVGYGAARAGSFRATDR